MSTNGAVVDIMIRPEELKLSFPDFSERILEPMLARLKKHLVLDPADTTVHMRIIARGLTEEQLNQLAELTG